MNDQTTTPAPTTNREAWGITSDMLKRVPAEMLAIIDDPKATRRAKTAAARALAQLHANNLRDLHHIEKIRHEDGILDLRMRRAEEGKPNDCIAIRVTPVRELPLPAALAHYRRRILESGESYSAN